jgi:hypothetical protein
MSITPDYRAKMLAYSYKKILITSCEPASGYIEGRDSANQPIQVTFNFFFSPYLQVPKVGEYWLVTRLDNNWVIHSRFEKDDEKTPTSDLVGGDIRINSPSRVIVDSEQGFICDGAASFGTVTTDSIYITNKITTPLVTELPTENVLNGQEERYQNNIANGIVWNFRYDSGIATNYKWHFIGGPAHISFVTGTVSTGGTSWFNSGTNTAGVQPFVYGGSPTLTIPYTGEYILSGGGETIASANNMGFNFGLSINGSIPTSTLTTYAPVKDTAMSVNTTYYVIFNAGDVLTEIYRKDPNHNPGGTASFLNRWMSVTPIRVTT